MSNVTKEMSTVGNLFGADRLLQTSIFVGSSFGRNEKSLQLNAGQMNGNDNSDVVEAINNMNK